MASRGRERQRQRDREKERDNDDDDDDEQRRNRGRTREEKEKEAREIYVEVRRERGTRRGWKGRDEKGKENDNRRIESVFLPRTNHLRLLPSRPLPLSPPLPPPPPPPE